MRQAGCRPYETLTVFDRLWCWLQVRAHREVPKQIQHREARQRLKRHGVSVRVEVGG